MTVSKIEKLLAYHRRHVFDAKSGDAHFRALIRLKKTTAYKAMCAGNEEAARQRKSDRLLRMYA